MYIIYSAELDRYYVGYSNDVEKRLKKHLEQHKGFTSRAKDWRVIYTEEYASKEAAYHLEREIKSWKSRLKIEELIKGE